MAIDTFIPTVWSAKLLLELRKALVYGQPSVINRDYEGEIKNAGDTVKIHNFGAVTVFNYTKNSDTCHVHDPQGKLHMYQKRRELNAMCNPLLGPGTLIYSNDYGTWRTPAFCRDNPYGNKLHTVQTLDVTFECPSAFWLSAEPVPFNLGYIEGGLIWPIETPNYWGTVGYMAHVINDGDAPAPFEMYMDGGSLNPVITNVTTGEFLKVERQIQTYDKIYINTDPENLTVQLMTIDPETNEPKYENAYGALSKDSVPFWFAVGRNELTFHTDDENREVRIRGTYYKRYAGV